MPEQPILSFENAGAFRQWLALHHAAHPGIWMRLAKKGSGIASVTYAEALDEALCFGWIDGQKKSFDQNEYLQKFTRRGPRSIWSQINTGHIERLTREARMQAAGLAAVEAAKADGRWDAAYQPFSAAAMPQDFLAALGKHKAARTFFESLNKSNTYAIVFRVTTAKKPETRAKRIASIIAMLQRGETFH